MSDKCILVVGASGFIGSRIVALLLARGNDVICAGRDAASLRRRFPSGTAIEADFSRDTTHTWAARLAGVEAVVNAAGAFRGDLDVSTTAGRWHCSRLVPAPTSIASFR